MVGGCSKDGAVSEQIEASINDELARMQARKVPLGSSLSHCAECKEQISEQRRLAVVEVKLCLDCVRERETQHQNRVGINRRGSKESQLKWDRSRAVVRVTNLVSVFHGFEFVDEP